MDAERKYLDLVERVIAEGPFTDTWESLSEARVPDWYRGEKFGIFMHWGVYSVPGFSNEWYPRTMYMKGSPEYEHHRAAYGQQKEFGYKDFIPMLTAENFKPAEILELYRRAGAGFIFPVAEHHDGFQMYRSELSHWNAAEMGPKRDILGEWRDAAAAEGIEFCCSTHRAEHWFFMGHGREFDSDIREPMKKGDFYWPAMKEPPFDDLRSEPFPSEEYLNDWLARTAELVWNYHPSLLYFDWWIEHEAFKPYLRRLAAFYYNCGRKWGKDVRICYKHDAMAFGCGIVDVERGGFAEPKPYTWQTDTAVARNSWCCTDSLDYRDSVDIIRQLVDVVSKNGHLLLNVGPRPDGTLPDGDVAILEDIASWMRVNGEALKGASCWRKSMEGPTRNQEGQFQDGVKLEYTSGDFRFTSAHGRIYAVCMRCPEDGKMLIRSLRKSENQNVPEFHGIIDSVDILGYEGSVDWEADSEGLHVRAPGLGGRLAARGIGAGYPVTVRIGVR